MSSDQTFSDLKLAIEKVAGATLTDENIMDIRLAVRSYEGGRDQEAQVKGFIVAQMFAGSFAGHQKNDQTISAAVNFAEKLYNHIKG